jgi:hypothetical protein
MVRERFAFAAAGIASYDPDFDPMGASSLWPSHERGCSPPREFRRMEIGQGSFCVLPKRFPRSSRPWEVFRERSATTQTEPWDATE